ncbi:hypothetical protein SDC9_210776 [bioreactor metagenome]|uniref:F5/8 type C domain-containing protein n=1 Tax=bioreactor metagenome TaxID=1076179 RepID=A0A645JIH5_9ZZZZ
MIVDYENRSKPLVVWSDDTPGQGPDWIELDFGKPVAMGKAVIYPVDNTLRDYEIQLWKDGRFETVATVKNASGKKQEISFNPLESEKLRVYITNTNGPHAVIDEIEVYAP